MRNVSVVENKGILSVFRAEFTDQKETKTVDFEAPSDPGSFQKYVATLPAAGLVKDEDGEEYFTGPLAKVYDEYFYAVLTHAKQNERVAVAQESTIIKRDGRSIDLMAIPVQKAILVVNAGFAMAGATESAPQTALAATQRKLIAAGKVKEVGEASKWTYKDEEGVHAVEYRVLQAA